MRTLTLPDGRTLEHLVEGPDDGVPLVLHHGTPGAAATFAPLVDAAARHGLRVVSPSRPGYGGSSPQPGRSVADVAADVAALLDALGADRFVTVGTSGGGPHALACAALLPGRCVAAATIAGVAPYDAEGVDFLAGMAEENHLEFGAALEGVEALTAFLEPEAAGLREVAPADLAEAFGGLVSEVDKAAMTGPLLDWLAATGRRAVEAGVDGWRDDDLAFVRPWGFDLGTIGTPVTVWYGDEDRMVPPTHGAWLAAHVSGATEQHRPAEGHLSLLRDVDAVVADLASHL